MRCVRCRGFMHSVPCEHCAKDREQQVAQDQASRARFEAIERGKAKVFAAWRKAGRNPYSNHNGMTLGLIQQELQAIGLDVTLQELVALRQ